MGTDVNWTYCGDHFNIYSNIESTLYSWNWYNVVYQLYLNKKKHNKQNHLNIVNEFSESLKVPHSHMRVTGSREDEVNGRKLYKTVFKLKSFKLLSAPCGKVLWALIFFHIFPGKACFQIQPITVSSFLLIRQFQLNK